MTPTGDRLTAFDATFLELEQADEGALMHIGGALVFAPVPGAETPRLTTLREHLAQRLDRLPRYRQRLDQPRTGGLAWPRWVPDEHFDISAHVRQAALAAPGDDEMFLEWVSDFYSHRLDRRRPLWEMVLLDGLAGGRWALVWKTHHCLVDGVGSVGVVDLLLDPRAAPHEEPEPATDTPAASDGVAQGGWAQPAEPIRRAAEAGAAAGRVGAHVLVHPRQALDRSRAIVDLLIRDELIAAPRTSLNRPIGSSRRIAAVEIELSQVQRIRSAHGGTINDVVLAAVTGGLRALLLQRGERPPPAGLRAMVPVNIRQSGQEGDLGNRVSSLFVELPVNEADPLARYQLVRATAEERKAGGQARAAAALTGLTELAPPVLHAGLARSLYARRLFNLTVTNVPGSPHAVGALGATLVGVVPIVPLAADHAVGVAVLSYAGTLTFGLCADRAGVPDLGVLRDGILTSLLDLEALAVRPSHALTPALRPGD